MKISYYLMALGLIIGGCSGSVGDGELNRTDPNHTLSAAMIEVLETSNQSITRPEGAMYDGKGWTFNKIAEGIYHAVGTDNYVVGAASNAVVIINEHDVVLVDALIGPSAVWSLMHELQPITTKPVTNVINTHFHYDHVHGNQFFDQNVNIISHPFTRNMIAAGYSQQGFAYNGMVEAVPL